MIDLTYIRGFYPPQIANNANFQKHLLKEYIELMAMEWTSQSAWSDKLAFIGGTNLRLIQGIDRFSEDLDFDCKNLSQEDFIQMTDGLMR
ncbi:MAG: nucleotidyl transferase AbiEii/AbiGii toxin family protein, partial [Paludibacteraceae bacterium]|nr:nucleotidyl transferase AbiEii/AbiGii toxin family protein [Paludibacteraceae bacterium]